MKNIQLTLIGFLFSLALYAQDAYFSNYQYSNALSNPTQMALSEDINLTLIHRSQWSNVVKPFTTSQFEGSYPIRQANTDKKIAVIGLSFVNDRLGEGGYLTTNQFALNMAYNLTLKNKNNIAIGTKLGYFNSATNLDGITTGSQFINGAYDPNPSNLGEVIVNPVVSGIEISPSVTWYQQDSLNRNKHYFGISAFNVNQPSSNALGTGSFKLPVRFSVTGGTNIELGKIGIKPNVLFMTQGGQNQVVLGTDLKVYMDNTSQSYQAFALGGYYRLGDAGIIALKYLSDVIDAGISYDMNTSKLSDGLGKSTGSFELFINYRMKTKSKVKQFEYLIEVYDSTTNQLTPATVTYKSKSTGITRILLDEQEKGSGTLNQNEEYIVTITKPGYTAKTVELQHGKEGELVAKFKISPTVLNFDLELEILDRATNEPVKGTITMIDPITGKETDMGEGDKLSTQLESGKKHTISFNAEGYENAILEIRYDKFGTLSKSLYVSKVQPKMAATSLKLTVLDETTKQPITSTIMAVNVTDPKNQASSLIALNANPPETYPLQVGNQFEILVTKEGYFNQTLKIDAKKIEDIERVILLSSIEIGKSIIVDDLLFKTGKTELDERSYRILDQLVDFLNQNPSIRIEMQGHTDSDGSDAANQTLSEGRAQSAVAFLKNKGISESRLVAKGYGESMPIATNETTEGKAKNRRVELKIIGK